MNKNNIEKIKNFLSCKENKTLLINPTSEEITCFYESLLRCLSLNSNIKLINSEYSKVNETSNDLFEIYSSFKEGEFCKIFEREFFYYTKVVIENPIIENGQVKRNKKGVPKRDPQKRDFERIPFRKNIDDYFIEEVLKEMPHAWMDRTKDKIGCEINFSKYFYKYRPLRSPEEISKDLEILENLISDFLPETNNA